jgi:PAS domain-containing protein
VSSAAQSAKKLASIELPGVATKALDESDDVLAMLVAQEAARRIGDRADPADFERDARRIAAEMQWHGGEPGPLFDASRDRLALFTPEGKIIFVGAAIGPVLGVPTSALEGRTLAELYPRVAERVTPEFRKVVAGGIVKRAEWFDVGAARVHVSYLFVPVWRGGHVVAVLLMGADTTESAKGSAGDASVLRL